MAATAGGDSTGRRDRFWRRLSPWLERLEDRLTPSLFLVANTSSADVSGSLFRAISDANSTPGPDTIQFDPAIFGQGQSEAIRLTSVLPTLADDVVIDGLTNFRISIERDPEAPPDFFGIFAINDGVSAELKNLRIAGGRLLDGGEGGGIQNRGILIVESCQLTGNLGASGGAIANTVTGDLTIRNSTLDGNSALNYGGAIFNLGTLNITGSTLSDNQAEVLGGAIANGGEFGGGGPVTITNSTLSGNTVTWDDDRAGGGALASGSLFEGAQVRATLTHVTVTANTSANGMRGGLWLGSGELFLNSSIVAGNTGNIQIASGTFSDLGHNVVDVDPRLDPLADNGGPTRTHALQADSPALDAGTSAPDVVVDQRGITRPQGPAADIGAFELEQASPELNVGGDGSATAGQPFVRAGQVTGAEGPFTVQVNYGDDTPVQTLDVGVDGLFQLSHTYASVGTYAVTVTLYQGESLRDSEGFFVIVEAQPSTPELEVGGDGFATAGQPFQRTGQVTGGEGTFTVQVSYGDDSPVQTLAVGPDGLFQLSHTYVSVGAYSVTVTLYEGEAVRDSDGFLVMVAAQPSSAELEVGEDGSATTGEPFTRTGQVTGGEGTFTVKVNYGDDTPVQTLTVGPDGLFQLSHTYAGEGTYSVTVTLYDGETVRDSDGFLVAVAAQPSSAELEVGEDGSAIAGEPFTRTGEVTDGEGTFTVTVNYGDGTPLQGLAVSPDGTFVLSHTYASEGTYVITVTLYEGESLRDSDGFFVVVLPQPTSPELVIGGDGSATAGKPFSRTGAVVGGEGPFTVTVDYGDGTPVQTVPVGADGTFSLSHTYASEDSYLVTVTLSEGGTVRDSDTFSVEVAQPPAPELVVVADQFGNAGVPFTRTGRVVNGEGPFTVTVSYGDRTPLQGLAVGTAGTFRLSHTYATEGSYLVTVTLYEGESVRDSSSFFVHVLLRGVPTQPAQAREVTPGQKGTVKVPGATVAYVRASDSLGNGIIIVANVPNFVAATLDTRHFAVRGLLISAAYDVRVINAGLRDRADITFRYFGQGPPTLTYYDRDSGLQVVIPSSMYVVDLVGQTITFMLNSFTDPRLQDMTGTVFTIAVPVPEPAPAPVFTAPVSVSNAAQLSLLLREPSDASAAITATNATGGPLIAAASPLGAPGEAGVSGLGISGGGAAPEAPASDTGPLRDLPRVPPVLINLPSVTVTPAGADPATLPETSTPPQEALESPGKEDTKIEQAPPAPADGFSLRTTEEDQPRDEPQLQPDGEMAFAGAETLPGQSAPAQADPRPSELLLAAMVALAGHDLRRQRRRTFENA